MGSIPRIMGFFVSCAVTVIAQVPTITQPPLSRLVPVGQSATFSVTATGTNPLAYQWSHNGQPIAGATSASLSINSAGRIDIGYYEVTVSNGSGSSTSTFDVALRADTDSAATAFAWGATVAGMPSGMNDLVSAAAADSQTLVLRGNGSVVGWGGTIYHETTVPAGVHDVVALVTNRIRSLVLQADETPVMLGVRTVPSDVGRVVGIGEGYYADLYVQSDGSVLAYSSQSGGAAAIPSDLTGVVAVAVGIDHALALKRDGTVVAWGDNSQFQTDVPSGLANVVAIAAGNYHNLALKADGTVVSWGGTGSSANAVPAGLSDVIAIAAGHSHSLALKADGTVVSWGSNLAGQTPVPAALALVHVAQIAAGGDQSVALAPAQPPTITMEPSSLIANRGDAFSVSVDATAFPLPTYQWKKDGQTLADSSAVSGATTARLTVLNATDADAGAYTVTVANDFGSVDATAATVATAAAPQVSVRPHSQIVPVGGTVSLSITASDATALSYQWRHNGTAIPGASTAVFTQPTVTLADAGIYDVVVTNATGGSAYGVCVVTVPAPGGSIVGWGDNTNLQLNVPATLPTVAAVSGTSTSTLALTADGTLVGWGTTANALLPVPMADQSEIVGAAIGGTVSVALKSDGTVDNWGSAAVAVPTSLAQVVAVAAGSGYAVALKSDGTLVAWGVDTLGQTNIPPGLGPVQAISCGGAYTLALRRDGTVAGWGINGQGEVNIPAGLHGVIALSAGMFHALALKQDGTVIAWGDNSNGSCNVPAGLTNVVAIAAGVGYSAAAKADGTIVTWGNIGAAPATASGAVQLYGTDFDAFAVIAAAPPVISGAPAPANQAVATGATVAWSVSADGTAPLSYQWQKDGVALPGETASGLTITNVQESDAGTYAVAVHNRAGDVVSSGAFLTVTGAPAAPFIRKQPSSMNTTAGTVPTVSVAAAGSTPLAFQWYQGSSGDTTNAIPGATNAALSFSNAPTVPAAYWARISNSSGAIDTRTARIIPWQTMDTRWPTGSIADNLDSASYANGHYFLIGAHGGKMSPDGLTWTVLTGSFGGGRVVYGHGVYVSGGGSTTGTMHVSSDGTTWSSVPSPHAGVVWWVLYDGTRFIAASDSGTIVTSTDGATWTIGYQNSALLFRGLAQGNGQYLAVALNGHVATSTDGLTWTESTPSVAIFFRAVAYSQHHYVALGGNTNNEIWVSDDAVSWTQSGMPDLPNGEAVPFSPEVSLASGDGMLVATVGNVLMISDDGVTWCASDGVLPAQPSYFATVAYGNGRFLVAGAYGNLFTTSAAGDAPAITAVSGGGFVTGGSTPTLTVSATGPNLSYQWYRGTSGDTSQPITSATGASTTLVAQTQNASYWVRVSNGVESVDGPTLAVSIAQLPSIADDAGDREVLAGSAVSLTATVSGEPVPTLQWYKGRRGDTTQPVANGTQATVSVTPGSATEWYWLRASNIAGSVDSTEYVLHPWSYAARPNVTKVVVMGGDFVGVNGSTVSTSSDGAAWTTVGTIRDGALDDIASGGGVYVAVGGGGFYSSTDLANWTPQNVSATPGVSNDASGVAYGNGVFVATGIQTWVSPNGADWTAVVLPSGIQLSSVVYDQSHFVAVGQSTASGDANHAAIFVSSDGSTWNRVAADVLPPAGAPSWANAGLTTVAAVNGRFLAISNEGQYVLDSDDGLTWVRHELAINGPGRPHSIAYFDHLYILGVDLGNYYLTSPDGATWTTNAGPPGLETAVLFASGAQLFAASNGSSGVLYSTSDDGNWTLEASVPSNIGNIAHGAGKYVAVGFHQMYASTDGVRWNLLPLDLSDQGLGQIAYGGGQFGLTTSTAGVLYQSVDGDLWWRRHYPSITAPIPGLAGTDAGLFIMPSSASGVAYGNGKFVAVGLSFWTSTDGTTWNPVANAPTGGSAHVAFGNGMFVAEGGSGTYTSVDGLNWTKQSDRGASEASLVFVGREFISLGLGISYSTDGVNWRSAADIAAGAKILTAAGNVVLADAGWHRAPDPLLPAISSQSQSVEVASGSRATVSVTAAGDSLAYQWYTGLPGDLSSAVPNATSSTLVTASVTSRQFYWVRVTGPNGSIDSDAIQVDVTGPPIIDRQPVSVDTNTGGTSTILEVGASSISSMSYQWYQGHAGDVAVPIAGAVGPRLVVNPGTREASYWVRVTNAHGTVDSNTAFVVPWSTSYPTVINSAFSSAGGIAWGAGKFVVTGTSGGSFDAAGIVETSVDGKSWTATTAPAMGPVVYGNGHFVAAALIPTNGVYRSDDGVTWTSLVADGSTVRFADVFFANDQFVVVSDGGTVAFSRDAETWSLQTIGTQRLWAATYGAGHYVLCGAGGSLWTSTDAQTWTEAASGTTSDLTSIAFGGGRFLAATSDGDLIMSQDAITWRPYFGGRTRDGRGALPGGQRLAFVAGRFYGGALVPNGTSYSSLESSWWWPTLDGVTRVATGNGVVVGTNQNLFVTLTPTAYTYDTTIGSKTFRTEPETDQPLVTLEPADEAVTGGDNVDLSVTVSSASTVSYQWRKDGVPIAGATDANLTISSVAVADAGNYSVTVTNSSGTTQSQSGRLSVAPPPAPAIMTQPRSQTVAVGDAATFSVTVTSRAQLTYQWQKAGVAIAGATDASYTISSATLDDAGTYAAVVSNDGGSTTTSSVNLYVRPVDMTATHAVTAATGGTNPTMTVTNTVTFSGTATALSWQVLLPAGWSIASSAGDDGATKPAVGATDLAEWTWNTVPASPVTFTYILNAPATANGTETVAALVSVNTGSNIQFMANPDPLLLVAHHSADTNGDGKISLLELTRVIELYNTRNGTTRTGCYAVQDGTEDGFAADSTRASSSTATLIKYHAADENHDGKISLLELTRVIELYNYRSGTTRTGQYHVQVGTEDGFAPGP